MKILIVGFGRSGTTMTLRIIERNRLIKRGFLETCLLAFYDKETLYRKHPIFNSNVVEKVIYGGDKLRKKAFGILNISIFDYCKMWLDYFGEEARIINLIRHPLDSLSSLIIKSGRRMKVRTPLKDIKIEDISLDMRKKIIKSYFNAIPKYPKMISQLPNTKTFKYESLILDGFEDMFKFCGLPYSSVGKIRKNRAFNYKRSGFRVEQPIGNIVDVFNEISRVQKYTIPRGSK